MRTSWVILVFTLPVLAFENHEASEDAAALQFDGFFGFPGTIDSTEADLPFSRIYGYSFFPILEKAGRALVGSLEFSVLPRHFHAPGRSPAGPILQSYGLGLGYETVHSGTQHGFAYGILGLNGDMRGLGAKVVYGDLSYTHTFTLSSRLTLGGGLDLHFYFEDYVPYPVLLLDWRIAEHTKLEIDFDTGEVKQFLSDRLSVSLGAQYDILHYAFGSDKGYAMETIAGMARLEYRISGNLYGRLSVKKPVWGGETLWTSADTEQEVDDHGISARLQAAYGI